MPEAPTTIFELPNYGSVLGTDRIPVDRLGAAVTAGAFVVDQAYQIVTVGSTSFTAIGAASNTVGVYFVATGAGSGNGTAAPINTGDAPLSAVAALLGGDPAGTAAAAVAAHVAAADPHPTYSTAAELSAAVAAHEAAADPHPTYTTAAELAAAIPGSTDAVPEGSVNRYFTATRAINAALTGFTAGAGTVSATDSILQAIQKIVGNIANLLPRTIETVNIAYSATINIDFAADNGKTLIIGTLTGPLTFTFSNIAQGRNVSVDLLCDSTQRALTFPGSTPFLGPKPSNIAASKAATLTFECRRAGTTDADVRAAYGVQP